jgi:hypothetical protein
MKVIYRFSDKGYPKNKLPLVNNTNCLVNFRKNFQMDGSDFVLILDNCSTDTVEKFSGNNVYSTQLGNAGSFNFALDYAIENFDDEEIIYFVEGDYIHDKDASKILVQGFELLGEIPCYVTLYAHPDKEFPQRIRPEYVFRSKNAYWRSCDSTTMTFAAKIKTLKLDRSTIKKWTGGAHPNDYPMFLELRESKRILISPMPGYSTHGEVDWLSPLKDWNAILQDSLV